MTGESYSLYYYFDYCYFVYRLYNTDVILLVSRVMFMIYVLIDAKFLNRNEITGV